MTTILKPIFTYTIILNASAHLQQLIYFNIWKLSVYKLNSLINFNKRYIQYFGHEAQMQTAYLAINLHTY
jgi:hypothetical protein